MSYRIKLFFIRHAFSCANYKSLQGIFELLCNTFRTDPKLADIGIRDLENYRSRVRKEVNPDYVFSSSLLRAIQTAQILFPEATVNVAPYIGEHGIGLSSVPKPPSEQLRYLNPDKVKYLYLGRDVVGHEGRDVVGHEHVSLDKSFKNRKDKYRETSFKKFLIWLEKRIPLNRDLTIAVVGHSNFMRSMLLRLKMTTCTDKVRNAGIIEMTLSHTQKGLRPYTKGCKPIKNVNKKESYKSPCYGVKFVGIKNPKCKAGNC